MYGNRDDANLSVELHVHYGRGAGSRGTNQFIPYIFIPYISFSTHLCLDHSSRSLGMTNISDFQAAT